MTRSFVAAAIAMLVSFVSPASAQTTQTTQMTQPRLPERDAVIAIMRKAADYQLEQHRLQKVAATTRKAAAATQPAKPPTTRKSRTRRAVKHPPSTKPYEEADNDWIRATFFPGIMALHDTTKDSKYRDAAIA